MRALSVEIGDTRAWATLIQTVAGLVLTGYCAVAFWLILRSGEPGHARSLVARGALTALSFIVCATLLKTLLLRS